MGIFDFLKPDVSAEDLYREAEQCFKSKDYATAVKLFEQAWDKDPDVGDFLSLSACYYYEWGTSKNETRCHELAFHGALKGNAQSMNNLAFFINTGYGCTMDKPKARKWFEKAVEKGNRDAKFTLACILHADAKDDPTLLDRCYRLMKECADNGRKEAQENMDKWFGPVTEDEWKGLTTVGMANRGYNWMVGQDGFEKNEVLAMRCLKAAAARGNAAAYCNIGWLLDQEGKHSEANEAYFKSANLGNTTAMINLARSLYNGWGWPKDDNGSRRYLQMAHEAGDKRAMMRMAEFFPADEVQRLSAGMTASEVYARACDVANGTNGQTRNAALAEHWYGRAAAMGVVAALYGQGVVLDEQNRFADAFNAYLDGARRGNTDCMYVVGTRYAEGKGCTRDESEANEWILKAHEAGDRRAMDKIKELNPTLERDVKVQFMLDNMRLCVEENFSSDEYDVEAMVRQLIDDEEYETARKLTKRCLLETKDDPDELGCLEDMRIYLAYIYYEDGDGNDEFDCPNYRLRLAHPLVVDLSSDFVPYWADTYMWLGTIYEELYANYDDAEIYALRRHRDRAWYGRQAYKYNLLAAEEGYYMAMYRTARYLIDGEVVDADYDEAYSWLKKCEDYVNGLPLFWLGNMHYYPEYGRENMVLALKYYEAYKEKYEDYKYSNGMITDSYAQTLANLAHLLLKKNTSIADSRARSMLEKVVESGFTMGDALYGYMLYEGRGGGKNYSTGLHFMRKAADRGDIMARQFLRNYGYSV